MTKEYITLLFQVIIKILFRFFIKNDLERENMILRKENPILKRKQKKPKIRSIDRCFFISIYRVYKELLDELVIVGPATILAWHRKLSKKKWDYSSRKHGRPSISEETKKLIIEIKKNNPRWGCRKIKGELKKLGIMVSKDTILKVLRKNGFPPDKKDYRSSLSWHDFIKSHYQRFWACDFFMIETLFLQRIYVFFIIEFPSRKLIHFAVTRSPKEPWLKKVFHDAIEICDDIPELVITDRDGIYGKWLKPFLREWYDIKHKRIPPACPFFNPYAERMVKTYKDEIFNNVIVFNQKDAENILTEYSAYYDKKRPHYSLDFNSPYNKFENLSFQRSKIRKKKVLNGLITSYSLAA